MQEEEELGLVAAAAARPAGQKLVVNHRSTPEEVAAFRAAVERSNQTLEERVAARLEEIWTPREERFAADLEQLWEEAAWLMQTGQFPDGRPMNRQKRIKLTVWGIFIGAINRRMYGGKPKRGEGVDEDDGDGEADDMP